MRSKWIFLVIIVLLLVIGGLVVVLTVRESGDKGEPVVQSFPPRITAPGTSAAATAPAGQVQTSTATQAQQTQAGTTADASDAIAAAKASAKANNPSLGELTVISSKMVGDWARVDMQPADRSADVGSWFLKKTGGEWVVVDFGTSVMRSDHPDAPAELFQ